MLYPRSILLSLIWKCVWYIHTYIHTCITICFTHAASSSAWYVNVYALWCERTSAYFSTHINVCFPGISYNMLLSPLYPRTILLSLIRKCVWHIDTYTHYNMLLSPLYPCSTVLSLIYTYIHYNMLYPRSIILSLLSKCVWHIHTFQYALPTQHRPQPDAHAWLCL